MRRCCVASQPRGASADRRTLSPDRAADTFACSLRLTFPSVSAQRQVRSLGRHVHISGGVHQPHLLAWGEHAVASSGAYPLVADPSRLSRRPLVKIVRLWRRRTCRGRDSASAQFPAPTHPPTHQCGSNVAVNGYGYVANFGANAAVNGGGSPAGGINIGVNIVGENSFFGLAEFLVWNRPLSVTEFTGAWCF